VIGEGYPESVEIVEVGPRDGLQNERVLVSTSAKRSFITALARSGLRRIEATAFVHPKAVPQMADAREVLRGLELPKEVELSALVPNMRGYESAREAGIESIAVFTATSESFNQRNIRCGIEESFDRFRPVLVRALEDGVKVRGYLSTVFGCPYEGVSSPVVALELTRRLLELGCYEVSLGDTIGVGTPIQVRQILEPIVEALGPEQLALHFHDTRGTALANVLVGLELGIKVFDSSAGGIGGCPYAPGAAGNLATEDLVYLLEGMGISTGVTLPDLAAASLGLEAELDHALPGRTVATFRPQ